MAEKGETKRRKRLIIITVLILLILLSILIVSYTKRDRSPRYVDGELNIIFNETVNETQAIEIIESYNLEIIEYPSEYFVAYRIKVPDGKENYYINLLEKYSEIKEVKRVFNTP